MIRDTIVNITLYRCFLINHVVEWKRKKLLQQLFVYSIYPTRARIAFAYRMHRPVFFGAIFNDPGRGLWWEAGGGRGGGGGVVILCFPWGQTARN